MTIRITPLTTIPLSADYCSIRISDDISFQDSNSNNCSILAELVVSSQRHHEYLSPGSKALVRLGQSQKGKKEIGNEKKE
jgi:hypothetical protein